MVDVGGQTGENESREESKVVCWKVRKFPCYAIGPYGYLFGEHHLVFVVTSLYMMCAFLPK